MSYLNELLADDEQIHYEAHQHPFVFLARIITETVVLLVLVGTVWFLATKGISNPQRPWILLILGVMAAAVFASAIYDFLRWRTEQFVLTDRRVMHLHGVINKSTVDSSLDKINDVQLRQTFFGRIFNYGDLEVQTASEDGTNYFQAIRAPLDFKRAMLNTKEQRERIPVAYAERMKSQPAAQNGRRLSQLEVEEQLTRLAELRQKNLITDDDFTAKKREILSRM